MAAERTETRHPEESSRPELWDRAWEDVGDDDYLWWYAREREGVRSRKIIDYLVTHLGELRGLRSVEVGSGAGIYSRLLAERGVTATLLDYSPEALVHAERHFRKAGLEALMRLASVDALALPAAMLRQFDIAMSFGTVEHFDYPERLEMARAHYELVRPGGAVIISVPNRAFLPHELFKGILQRSGRWGLGYEEAFTRGELRRVGSELGLNSVRIVGSALRTDLRRYARIVGNSNKVRRLFPSVGPARRSNIDEVPTPLDNLFGADLVLMGIR